MMAALPNPVRAKDMNAESSNSEQWLPDGVAFAHMETHRVIRVSGADAAALLQGQFSNDIAALDINPAQFSSYNSPKGRVLAFLRVLKRGDEYWLVVDADILDVFVQRLKMFVLRSKVSIDVAENVSGIIVAGPAAAEQLAATGLPTPAVGESTEKDGCVYFGVPGPAPRIEIYGPVESMPSLKMNAASAEDLARWDVVFRLPRIMEGNRDAHVAQHLGLDELGAINFKKGCYTGQEIIARMKYLGKVKKRPAVFAGKDVKVGDAIRAEGDRSAGEVVNVADANGKQLVLAVINLDDQDKALNVNGESLTPL